MTVHQRNEESGGDSCFPVVSPCGKNNWSGMENGSLSWDRNSRGTSSSWPGDTEEAATRKVLQLWDVIERNLFDEVDDESLLERSVSEECEQWRAQLTHIRVVGKRLGGPPCDSNNVESATGVKSRAENRSGDEMIIENSGNDGRWENGNAEEDRNSVFDRIFEFVYSELSRETEKKEETDSLGRDLDDVLRITPAPTCSARNTMKGRKIRDSRGTTRKTSANENRRRDVTSENDAAVESGCENDRGISATDRNTTNKSIDNNGNVESDVEDSLPQTARNKLGTIFNEKIVVSPVPFVLSQRESFTTLRTTPISFRAQTFDISTPKPGSGRYMNSASKSNSAQRMSGYRISQSHSAWQTPVCPAVWPKNIRLAPIDPSRLPSSKIRSSSDSPGVPAQRNRNSLSPITRPTRIFPSATLRDHTVEGLEIQGKQMMVRSAKQNHPPTTTTDSPRCSKSSRGKVRSQKRQKP